jgi:hypothetical protein
MEKVFTDTEIQQFITKGFIRPDHAFPRGAGRCRAGDPIDRKDNDYSLDLPPYFFVLQR